MKKNNGRVRIKTGKADPVCFLKRTIGEAMWQTEQNRVDGKDTNLDLIPSASVTDALIRQKGNMLFCNTSSYLKPLLLNFTDWTWVTSLFPLETTKKNKQKKRPCEPVLPRLAGF